MKRTKRNASTLLMLPCCVVFAACSGGGDPKTGDGSSGDGSGARPGYQPPRNPGEGFGPDAWTPPTTTLAGGVVRTEVGQPGELETVCEYNNAWRLHSRHGAAVSVVPQRQYITSCEDEDGWHVFVSLPVWDGEERTQYVYESILNESTGEFVVSGNARHLPECQDASGLAAAPDCSFVGVLCHRAYGTSDNEEYDADLIRPYGSTGSRDEVLARDNDVNDKTNTEMWLYEYPGADLSVSPATYLAHLSVRATETARPAGQYYLKYSAEQDSYAMALRASVTGNGGGRHVADAFLVIRRGNTPADWSIATDRGYPWACGRGHTDYNHPGYNPISNQFAVTCRTDIAGGIYFRTDTMGKPDPFHNVESCCGAIGGGSTTFAAHADGGFLLAMMGHDPTALAAANATWEGDDYVHPNDVWGALAPTSVGLARFDATGAPTGEINWIVHSTTHYLGHPQVMSLGNDRYLLGWSEQYRVGDVGDDVKEIWGKRRRHSFQSAWGYYLMEIDAEGNRLTEPTRIEGAGWGDFDEWTRLGEGRVAWHYIADPELIGWEEAPPCDALATPSLFFYESRL